MKHDPLAHAVQTISLPPQLHARCMQGVHCAQQTQEEKTMKNTHTNSVRFPAIKRWTAVAAAVALCTVVLGGTALADSFKGFFADVTRLDGAVTGTEYHAAAEELNLTAGEAAVTNEQVTLPVTVEFAQAEEAPFAYLEHLDLGEAVVQTADGETIAVKAEAEPAAVADGTVRLMVRLSGGDLPAGQYTLIVRSFFGLAKAEQPLPILGQWSCSFTVS